MKTYIHPTIDIVRLSSDSSLLNTLGGSGDIHSSMLPTTDQSGNRAPKRAEVF